MQKRRLRRPYSSACHAHVDAAEPFFRFAHRTIDGPWIAHITYERQRAFAIALGHTAPGECSDERPFIEKRATDLVADTARRTRHENDSALKIEVHDERIG